jgi:hypothetical protein
VRPHDDGAHEAHLGLQVLVRTAMVEKRAGMRGDEAVGDLAVARRGDPVPGRRDRGTGLPRELSLRARFPHHRRSRDANLAGEHERDRLVQRVGEVDGDSVALVYDEGRPGIVQLRRVIGAEAIAPHVDDIAVSRVDVIGFGDEAETRPGDAVDDSIRWRRRSDCGDAGDHSYFQHETRQPIAKNVEHILHPRKLRVSYGS